MSNFIKILRQKTDLSDSVGDLGLDKSRVVGADGSDHVDPGSTADSWDSHDILQIFVTIFLTKRPLIVFIFIITLG